MAEYIDREKAINEFAIRSSFYDAEWGNKRFTPDDVEEILQSIPATDVRPAVYGRWIVASDTSGNEYYRCSECGTYFERTFFGNDYTVNGCPVCFADMRENTDQEQVADNAAHRDICGATGLPCCRCNPGACESRK